VYYVTIKIELFWEVAMEKFSHEVIELAYNKMEKSKQVFFNELVHIRAGRANPQMLDNIKADYYGTPTPINQMANISSPEPRLLLISLWDAGMLHEVEKAIQKSDLGINPSNDGKAIRLLVPELTQERRLEIVKGLKKKSEEQKVTIRNIRRDTNEALKKMQKGSEITEDDLEDFEKEVQKLTDDFIAQTDKLTQEKEKEIMSV